VVFDLNRQPSQSRFKWNALGHCPAFEHAFHLQTKVIVEIPCLMPMNDKAVSFASLLFANRFRSPAKCSLTPVFFKVHDTKVCRAAITLASDIIVSVNRQVKNSLY
jgi:hypothetical protein